MIKIRRRKEKHHRNITSQVHKSQEIYISGAHGDCNSALLWIYNSLELSAYLVIWNVACAQGEKTSGYYGIKLWIFWFFLLWIPSHHVALATIFTFKNILFHCCSQERNAFYLSPSVFRMLSFILDWIKQKTQVLYQM